MPAAVPGLIASFDRLYSTHPHPEHPAGLLRAHDPFAACQFAVHTVGNKVFPPVALRFMVLMVVAPPDAVLLVTGAGRPMP
jgi:hypothetical protein